MLGKTKIIESLMIGSKKKTKEEGDQDKWEEIINEKEKDKEKNKNKKESREKKIGKDSN